ncbi:hypothetical protein LINPERPRIM_LOCUS25800 [Linum perenne]
MHVKDQNRECWYMRGYIMEAWTASCMEDRMVHRLIGMLG